MDTRSAARLGYTSDDASDLQSLRSLVFQAISLGFGNYAYIDAASTTNGQAPPGTNIVALLPVVSKASGVFVWWVSAFAALVATDAVVWTVTTQTGTGAVTTTGAGIAPGGSGPSVGTGTGAAVGLVNTAAANTSIIITGGGGGSLTQYVTGSPGSLTIGTAAVGSAMATGGILQNSVVGATRTRFTLGNNVLLVLSLTGVTSSHVITDINMVLVELPLAPT